MQQLAERPDDRSLRLVFADWLLELGDPRGEAIALGTRGDLALSERRRLARLTQQHMARWLGPLAVLADLGRTRFVGGFLDELVCASGALLNDGRRPIDTFEAFTGDPRLATATALVIPPSAPVNALAAFVSHPVFRGLQRLELGSAGWRLFKNVALHTTRPEMVVLSSWGVFERELGVLADVPLFLHGSTLGLSTTEFLNPLVVNEVLESLIGQSHAMSRFSTVQLIARYGVLEGVAAWLLAAPRFARLLPTLQRWSVESGEVALSRTRSETGFDSLTIDLALPEGPGEKQSAGREAFGPSKTSTEVRIATAASVLVQLAAAKLRRVEVKMARGARLKPAERSALLAAARRSGTLEEIVMPGDVAQP